jgi:WD40 repeat protein
VGFVSTAEFSPDGKIVATSSQDGTARLWEARTGRSLAIFPGHTDVVNGASFNPDGTLLATPSVDHTVRIYRCSVCGSLDELLARAHVQLARG